ncbi:MAG: hypothetical protein ACI8RD_013576, partial [Bacillariaceae sp.]
KYGFISRLIYDIRAYSYVHTAQKISICLI